MGDTLPMRHAVEANTIARGPRTWQLYLVLGFFQFVLNLQGNIFPFLRVELDISYRTIGLHPTAYACGIILVGLLGPRVISHFGRQWMLMVGVFGFATAAVLLCLAPAAPVSIASFALLGMSGAFIPVIVFSTLADVHAEKRAVAFNEATAIASIFGIIAPILTGLCIYAGLGWRSAVLVGVAYGVAVLASLTRVGVPAFDTAASAPSGMLPPAYWAYWTALAFGIATEFCVLLWAPTYPRKRGRLIRCGRGDGGRRICPRHGGRAPRRKPHSAHDRCADAVCCVSRRGARWLLVLLGNERCGGLNRRPVRPRLRNLALLSARLRSGDRCDPRRSARQGECPNGDRWGRGAPYHAGVAGRTCRSRRAAQRPLAGADAHRCYAGRFPGRSEAGAPTSIHPPGSVVRRPFRTPSRSRLRSARPAGTGRPISMSIDSGEG